MALIAPDQSALRGWSSRGQRPKCSRPLPLAFSSKRTSPLLSRERGAGCLAPLAAPAQPTNDTDAARGNPGHTAAAAEPPIVTSQEILGPDARLARLRALLPRLEQAPTYSDKLALLLREPEVDRFLRGTREGSTVARQLPLLTPKQAYALACLPAIGQQHVLSVIPTNLVLNDAFERLSSALARVEEFYDSIGGLPGYQLQCLQLILGQHNSAAASGVAGNGGRGSGAEGEVRFLVPQGLDLSSPGSGAEGEVRFLVPQGLDLSSPAHAEAAAAATAAGLLAQPLLAEVYPLGGAGDRLGLCCEETGDSLPTAVLPYCGRSLLETLIRDLQAREYLHYRLYGRQYTTPVAVMTSAAKGNHWRVQRLFEASAWFGRGAGAFRLFQQPLVPMVAAGSGEWLLPAPLEPLMKPGGHGVIWKLMLDAGVFGWLAGQGRRGAIVRQISNPMAGQDNTLLALAGAGVGGGRAFGFASCERVVGAAEGMNVLLQQRLPPAPAAPAAPPAGSTPQGQARYSYRVTNVEYTEFEKLGIEDKGAEDGSPHSLFPANTNVLYVGLNQVESVVRGGVEDGSTAVTLPGMILNTAKEACYRDAVTGVERRVRAGRLECTMQNLADCFATELDAPPAAAAAAALPTFLVYGPRRKVTSSAKRQRAPGSTKIHQTPDGSFYDLQRNAAEMLARGGVEVPDVGSVAEYLAAGPRFIFLFHPALGPLWDVVAQKVRGGRVAAGSEVQLEVAEAELVGVDVQGSLLVVADDVMGHMECGGGGSKSRGQSGNGSGSGSGRSSGGSGNGTQPGSAADAWFDEGRGDDDAPCEGPPAAAPAAQSHPRLVYSDRCGRVRLRNVSVRNLGVDWSCPDNVYWRHRVARRQACRILLRGCAEFEAVDVELSGDLTFEVPDGHRMRVRAGPGGAPAATLEEIAQPTWRWAYSLKPGGLVELTLCGEEEPAAARG